MGETAGGRGSKHLAPHPLLQVLLVDAADCIAFAQLSS